MPPRWLGCRYTVALRSGGPGNQTEEAPMRLTRAVGCGLSLIGVWLVVTPPARRARTGTGERSAFGERYVRSEEHTSELQSQSNLVCRLLLEKKKNIINTKTYTYDKSYEQV